MRAGSLRNLAIAGALAALPFATAAPITPALAQSGNGGWNTTYATTEGGHRVGNPEAATRLITFVSYSCPHCATFEKESEAALRAGYIQNGKLSLEVRHVIRNPIDLAAALATECGTGNGFFARHRAMMAAQPGWLATLGKATEAQQQRWTSGTLAARMQAIAADLDFYELMEPRGASRAQLDRCLADEARANAIVEHAAADSERYAIPGTPSFVVNGKLLEGVHRWSGLKPALDSAS